MYRCYYEKEKKFSVQSVQVYTVYRLLFYEYEFDGQSIYRGIYIGMGENKKSALATLAKRCFALFLFFLGGGYIYGILSVSIRIYIGEDFRYIFLLYPSHIYKKPTCTRVHLYTLYTLCTPIYIFIFLFLFISTLYIMYSPYSLFIISKRGCEQYKLVFMICVMI